MKSIDRYIQLVTAGVLMESLGRSIVRKSEKWQHKDGSWWWRNPKTGQKERTTPPGKTAPAKQPGPAAPAVKAEHYKPIEFRKFAKNMDKHVPKEYIPYITQYTPEQYKEMGAKVFSAPDGKSGFAVKPDGDIISVYSAGGGRLGGMLARAMKEGGKKMDCLGGALRDKYRKNGFKVYKADNWNKEYKHPLWSYKAHDHPKLWYLHLPQEDAMKSRVFKSLSDKQIQDLEDEEYRDMTREQIINTFKSVKSVGEPVDIVKLKAVLKKFGK